MVGNNSKLLDYLLRCAERLDYQAKDRSTPLQLAYRLNSAVAVSTLLKHGATIPFKDTRGSSLSLAASRYPQTIQFWRHVRDRGKCLCRVVKMLRTWQRLLATTDGRPLYTPIHHTAANGQAKLLDFFLSNSWSLCTVPNQRWLYHTTLGST